MTSRVIAMLPVTLFVLGGCVYRDACFDGAHRVNGVCQFDGPGSDAGSDGSVEGGVSDTRPCTMCAGECVDTETDADNCGSCGTACGWDACVAGACALPQEIAVLGGSTCALLDSGDVWCWGRNLEGQLGSSLVAMHEGTAVPVRAEGLSNIAHIWGSTAHVCAVNTAGRVYCWGMNGGGQVGTGSLDPIVPLPTPITAARMYPLDVGVGSWTTCAIYLFNPECFGGNDFGQVGSGAVSADPVLTAERVVRMGGGSFDGMRRIEVGDHHACAISDARGELWCWGDNSQGQLGVAGAGPESYPYAQQVMMPSGVEQVSLGESHSCARIADGRVHCWGANADGQVGTGTTSVREPVPTEVFAFSPTEMRTTDVAAGKAHSCARVTDGRVFCWGDNSSGQLGTGDMESAFQPREVSGLSDAVELETGQGHHTCVITESRSIRCWGDNTNEQLGQEGIGSSSTPAEVQPPRGG